MKLTQLFFLLLCMTAFTACEYDTFEDDDSIGAIEFENRFVRIATGTVDGMETVTVNEDNTSTTLEIEYPFQDESDIDFTYELGGTAEYGTIYEIDGASASGGSGTVIFMNDDPQNTAFAREDVVINYLVDTLEAGPQTIEFTLTSASGGDGNVEVGQTADLRRTITLNLVND